ncbi:MAG: hypothetical protein NZ651_06270 [Candidatus Bipolaricaulota bacterium]|nr:hypothetical protein [Candidatus Bipolaricaulota bacterium]MDW8127359.1 hypothetical protein [Candidatus Bipolaricaulota bacterium]
MKDLDAFFETVQEAVQPPGKALVPLAAELTALVVQTAKEQAESDGIPTEDLLSEITETLKGHDAYAYDSGGLFQDVRVQAEAGENEAYAVAYPEGLTRARYRVGAPRTSNQGNPLPYRGLLQILEMGHEWHYPSTIKMFRYLAFMLRQAGMTLPKSEDEPGRALIYVPPRPLFPEPLADRAAQLLAERAADFILKRLEMI